MPISVQINFKRKGVIAENIKLKFWLTKKKRKASQGWKIRVKNG